MVNRKLVFVFRCKLQVATFPTSKRLSYGELPLTHGASSRRSITIGFVFKVHVYCYLLLVTTTNNSDVPTA